MKKGLQSISRPFGLRLTRLSEWTTAVRYATTRTLSYRDWRKMGLGLLRTVLRRSELPGAATVRARYRTCMRCPLRRGGRAPHYDADLGVWAESEDRPPSCGPIEGAALPLGCGCYLPYLVATTPVDGECWGRTHLKGKGGVQGWGPKELREPSLKSTRIEGEAGD